MKTAYRVYEAAEGSDLIFCGEFDDQFTAETVADSAPGGIPRSLWDTARAAGHCAGMVSPEGGVEDDEPLSWHADHHCVVQVTYEDHDKPR